MFSANDDCHKLVVPANLLLLLLFIVIGLIVLLVLFAIIISRQKYT